MQGTYRGKAQSWVVAEGKSAPQIAVQFNILTEGAEQPSVTWYGSFSDLAWERTVESLRHMGWKGSDLDAELVGLDTNEVDLVIGEEEYNGKTQTKVQWVNRAGGVAVKAPLTGDKLKSFAAQMKAKINGLDASKGQKPAAQAKPNGAASGPPSPTPPPITESDLPF